MSKAQILILNRLPCFDVDQLSLLVLKLPKQDKSRNQTYSDKFLRKQERFFLECKKDSNSQHTVDCIGAKM
jgi:hypothetical protein